MTPAEEDHALALAHALADFEPLMASSWADAPEPDAGGILSRHRAAAAGRLHRHHAKTTGPPSRRVRPTQLRREAVR